jgi:hypothetical protein
MANYCEAKDIQFLLGFDTLFDANSTPTLVQINDAIETITGEIDFELQSVGVTVQPSNPNLLKKLKAGCMNGVACWAGMSGFGNNTTVNDSQPSTYCTDYKELLKEINEKPEKYGLVTGDDTTFLTSNVLDGSQTEAEITGGYLDRDYEV